MKKLLKYGVVSLSLTALGVVASLTDVPVIGTVSVYAEDGAEQANQAVTSSQEGSKETVEITNEPLKEAILRSLYSDKKIDYETYYNLTTEVINVDRSEEKGWISEPNPNYLNYNFSQEELDSVTSLDTSTSIGGQVGITDIMLPVRPLEVSELRKLNNLKGLSIFGTTGIALNDLNYGSLGSVTHLGVRSHYDRREALDAAKLTQASQLEFISGEVTNISALTALPNLKHLVIEPTVRYLEDHTTVATTVSNVDLQALIDKGQLETLTFTTDSLADLPSFANLKNLRRLQVTLSPTANPNQVFDLEKLKTNTQLEALSIQHFHTEGSYVNGEYNSEPQFRLANAEVLKNFPHLTHLNLNRFSDVPDYLGTISQLLTLTSLKLTGGRLTDVSSLSNLSNLETLVLANNQIEDISPLVNLGRLKDLNVVNNRIGTIESFLKEPNRNLLLSINNNPVLTTEFRTKLMTERVEGQKLRVVFNYGKGASGGPGDSIDRILGSSNLFRQALSGELDKPLQTPPPSDGGNDNPSTPDAPPSNPDNGDGGQGGGDTQTPPPADNDGGSNDGGSTDADKDTGTTPDTPQPPATPTPKTLGSTKAPVTVTVSGKDSSAISTIETSRVTDQSVLAKLPSSLPQTDVELYDIKTVDDKGNFVQITEPATVTLSVDPSRKVGKVFYFLPETGMVEELKFTRSDDQKTVSFVVTHFSQYGVVYEPTTQTPPVDNGGATTVTPPTTNNGSSTGTTGTSVPNTPPVTSTTLVGTTTPTIDGLSGTRDQLIAQVDNSRLSDQQKGDLAEKISFAQTVEELDKIKLELSQLTKPVDKKPETSVPAASSTQTAKTENVLPKTGDATSLALTGLGLVTTLASLGLAHRRKVD